MKFSILNIKRNIQNILRNEGELSYYEIRKQQSLFKDILQKQGILQEMKEKHFLRTLQMSRILYEMNINDYS